VLRFLQPGGVRAPAARDPSVRVASRCRPVCMFDGVAAWRGGSMLSCCVALAFGAAVGIRGFTMGGRCGRLWSCGTSCFGCDCVFDQCKESCIWVVSIGPREEFARCEMCENVPVSHQHERITSRGFVHNMT
jgi:hypothetical protein